MARRLHCSILLAVAAALLGANIGFVSAAGGASGRHAAESSHVDGHALVDTTAAPAFVSLVEARSDRIGDRAPQALGVPATTADAAQLQTHSIVTNGAEHAPGSSGGPATGSRAPPAPAAHFAA